MRVYFGNESGITVTEYGMYNGSYNGTITHTTYSGNWHLWGGSLVSDGDYTWAIAGGPSYSSGPTAGDGGNNVNPVVPLYN